MQFDGLLHDSYPIRGNRYVRQHWESGNYYLDGKFRLLDKGLRTLRINREPSFAVRAHVINFAIENRDSVRWVLGDWLVDLSPQKRDYDDSARFCVSHSITVTNQNGAFSDGAVGTFIDRLRLVLSVINMKCCEIVPTAAYDGTSEPTGYMIHQLHCDPFDDVTLFYQTMWSEELYQRLEAAASGIYHRISRCPPHYLEGLDMLVCDSQNSIPSFWTILEKACGSGPANVRTALADCVESIQIPSEHRFLREVLDVRSDADFIDIFYAMRNHLAHERNQIAKGQPIPPEAHTIVSQLAELLAWAKILSDLNIDSWLLQEARASFAAWEFQYAGSQPTTLNKFQADGTYNAIAAIRRLVRGGETPGKVSAFFETPKGQLFFGEPTDWPKTMPSRSDPE